MTDKRHGTQLWRRIALPLSIVLNLFLVAVIGGHIWYMQRAGVNTQMPLARALANAEASLSPRDAAAFDAVMRRGLPHYTGAARHLAQTRQELERQIAAEKFDKTATRRALTAWRVAWSDYVDAFSDTLVDALAQISPEGRRTLVNRRRSEHLAPNMLRRGDTAN